MKKFVGLVNGQSFDNEKDWTKAAQEAIKNNDGNLAISSYYTYTNDEEEEKEEKAVVDPKFVSTYEYFLGGRTPDAETENGIEYQVSDKLKNRLIEASNKNDIKKSLNYHINKLKDNTAVEERCIKNHQERLSNLLNEVEKETNNLEVEKDKLKDMKARDVYYNTLFDIISEAVEKEEEEKKEEEVKEEKKEYVRPEIKTTNIRELFGLDPDTSLYDVLRQIGILR